MEPTSFDGADGVKIAADIGGPVNGPVVILLHGGGQTRQSWGGTAQTLAGSGYRVITLDARGHGESGESGEGRDCARCDDGEDQVEDGSGRSG